MPKEPSNKRNSSPTDESPEVAFRISMQTKREKKGWSQSEFAKRLQEKGLGNFHQTTVKRVEAGERPLKIGEAKIIADVLGSTLDVMMIPTDEQFHIDTLIELAGKINELDLKIMMLLGDYWNKTLLASLLYERAKEANFFEGTKVYSVISEPLDEALDVLREHKDGNIAHLIPLALSHLVENSKEYSPNLDMSELQGINSGNYREYAEHLREKRPRVHYQLEKYQNE